MDWKTLENLSQISDIHSASFSKPQLIFKHSIRCGVSLHVLHTIEQQGESLSKKVEMNYLDLLANRQISNTIEAEWGVRHQSPQAILLFKGKVIYHASHYSINTDEVLKNIPIN